MIRKYMLQLILLWITESLAFSLSNIDIDRIKSLQKKCESHIGLFFSFSQPFDIYIIIFIDPLYCKLPALNSEYPL